jgi:hypothetical protein
MPAIRPEDISNRIRLLNERRAAGAAFVSEHGAVDSFLPAVVDELPPDEQGICSLGSQDNFLSGANEQLSLSPIGVSVCGVVPLI